MLWKSTRIESLWILALAVPTTLSPLWLITIVWSVLMCSLACWKCFQTKHEEERIPLGELEETAERNKKAAIKRIVLEQRRSQKGQKDKDPRPETMKDRQLQDEVKQLKKQHERIFKEKDERIQFLEKEIETARSKDNTHHNDSDEPEVTVKHNNEMNNSKSYQRERDEMMKKLQEVQAKADSDRQEYERRLKAIRDDHTVEFDEMLVQLDQVEQEEKERNLQQEQLVAQKDAIINALGTKLNQAVRQEERLSKERQKLVTELEEAKKDATTSREGALALELSLTTKHQNELTTLRIKNQQACERIKQDMIASAHEQFDKANGTYMQLKKEYNVTKKKLTTTQQEMVKWKKQAEQAKHKYKEREVETAAELAQLRADLASSEAAAARESQRYQTEMQLVRASEQALKLELNESKANCSAAHASLASLVMEKNDLMKEFEETKNVCEELMTMVEKEDDGRTLKSESSTAMLISASTDEEEEDKEDRTQLPTPVSPY